ncbi:hypothetical protein [Xanthobacter wiegelii]|uniref:hypothetical protein n=1 Tax=Xanthobacter wiegelii TaxID=3119913 RepID=UPI00372666DC
MTDRRDYAYRGLRWLSNLVVLLALLLSLDLGLAWWRGTPSVSCQTALALSSEGAQMAIGMVGIVIGLVGIMLGGARHPLTGFGLLLLIGGVLGSALLPEPVAAACGG